MKLLRTALTLAGVGLLLVGTAPLAEARPRIKLKLGKAIVKGNAILLTGDAEGLPNGAILRTSIKFQGSVGLEQLGEVKGGAFEVRFGDGKKKLLPGTYSISVQFDPRIQNTKITKLTQGAQVVAGTSTVLVGTPELERAERAEIKKKYEFYLGAMQGLNGSMDTYGSSLVTKAAIEKLKGRGKVSPSRQAPITSEWGKFTELFDDQLPTIRFDIKSFRGILLISYYPEVDAILTEIGTNLDQKHAGLTTAIYNNLGAPVPKQIKDKKVELSVLASIKRGLPELATRAYKALGLEPVSWKPIDAETPEDFKDIDGNVFRSRVSKFEITKPAVGWLFDTGPMSTTMRLRMRNTDKELTKKLVSGVELRDYPLAENNKDLALLDENWTRGHWPGFELIESKRIMVRDKTMPNGKRPGQEMRYTFVAGPTTFQVIQYSLFCRWHKRTYTVMSFADLGVYPDWEKTFEKINSSFRILDAPKLQERLKKEEDRRKAKEAARKKREARDAEKGK
jgi:hypothetical protein